MKGWKWYLVKLALLIAVGQLVGWAGPAGPVVHPFWYVVGWLLIGFNWRIE